MEEAYLEYNHMVIRYQGNLNLIKDLDGCDVLGKSNLFLLERWSGNYDYTLLFLPQDKLSLDFQDEVITLYGDLEYLKRTTMIQVIVFLLYQRKNCLNGIISFHAAAVLYRDTLILFMGPKGSGKTSLSYYFSQKYEDIRLIANDYLEIELDFNRGAFTVVASDSDKTITFRSHVLYHLDHALYQKILVLMNLYLINQLKWRESLPILKMKVSNAKTRFFACWPWQNERIRRFF